MGMHHIVEQIDNQRRKVDFDTFDIIVQQLVSMVESGAIDVAPAYQRQFRWDDKKKSELVESVFLGVPVPSLFMAANRDGTWELVDGVQRLSTLVQFAGSEEARRKLGLPKPLTINHLEKISELNGVTFEQLPDSLKLQFRNRPIKVITLSDKSDMVVRFDLFERLNTGGVALTDQEIRACIFRGPFNQLLDRLSQDKDFRKTVRLTRSQESDGTRQECVLRFFAYLFNYKEFNHSVVNFLNSFMLQATKDFDYTGGERIFRQTFSELAKIIPNGIVRNPSRKTTPLNLFEAVAVGAALALQAQGRLNDTKPGEWLFSEELRKLTTGATNSKKMVAARIEHCRDHFLG